MTQRVEGYAQVSSNQGKIPLYSSSDIESEVRGDRDSMDVSHLAVNSDFCPRGYSLNRTLRPTICVGATN